MSQNPVNGIIKSIGSISIMDGGKVKIFDRAYSLKKLQRIGQGRRQDDVLEWINQDLD